MSSQSLRDAAKEFLTLVASGKVCEAYGRHVGAGFRHHNPYFRGDAEFRDVGQGIPEKSIHENGMF